jgi:lysophospholipase L1-like esterase
MMMVNAACLELDGVDTITTTTNHGSIVSYEGTTTPGYDGATITGTAGTLYHILFSDSTHYRCAEGSVTAAHILSDDGLHSGEIVSTDLAAVRAGRQSTYFGNARFGFGYREQSIEQSGDNYDVSPWGLNNLTGEASITDGNLIHFGPRSLGRDTLYQGFLPVVAGRHYVVGIRFSQTVKCAITVSSYEPDFSASAAWTFYSNSKIQYFPFDPLVTGIGSIQIATPSGDNVPEVDFELHEVQFSEDATDTDLGTIVSIGDSLTYVGMGDDLIELFPASNVINSGISGDTLVMMDTRFNTDVLAHTPEYVNIWGGLNDINTVSENPIESMKIAMQSMCAKAQSAGIAHISLGNITGHRGSSPWTSEREGWADEYNLWLEQFASSNGFNYVDMYVIWGSQAEPHMQDQSIRLDSDGLHPQLSGYNIAASAFAAYIPRVYPIYVQTKDYTFDGTERLPFLTDHKGNTWNGAEHGVKFAEVGVGNFDGVGDSIATTLTPATSRSLQAVFKYKDTGVAYSIMGQANGARSYIQVAANGQIQGIFGDAGTQLTSGPYTDGEAIKVRIEWDENKDCRLFINNVLADSGTYTGTISTTSPVYIGSISNYGSPILLCAEKIWEAEINGTLILLNDGQIYGDTTTDIHDSNGNVIGTLTSSNVPTFWGETVVPWDIQQMDTDGFFINNLYEGLEVDETIIRECGAELQENNHFTADLSGYSVTTNWAWESPGVARHSTGSVVSLTSSITLVDAIEYEIKIVVGGSTAGTVTSYAGSGTAGTARGNGTFTERLICSGSTDFLLTPTTDFDGYVDVVSVRKVDQLFNYNNQYYFGSRGATMYESALTNAEDELVLNDQELIEYIQFDGIPVAFDANDLFMRN